MLAIQLMLYILITLTNAITRTKEINLLKSGNLMNVNKKKNCWRTDFNLQFAGLKHDALPLRYGPT